MKSKGGFTLVEVLVSLAVIIVLMSVIMLAPRDARQKAGLTRAKAEMNQIATGALLFYQSTGSWAVDVLTLGGNATFYTPQYIDITGTSPSSYLGSEYKWDWQNWDFPNSAGFQCWQSVDLYREDVSNKLVMRKCVRNVCVDQKYCNQAGTCFNTKADRDSGTGSIGSVNTGYSAVCENCTSETDCANKFER